LAKTGGVNWFFHPTTYFYKETLDLDFFELPPYDKNIQPNAGFDFYYVFNNDYENFLIEKYELEKKLSNNFYLLKKKN